MIHLIIGGARSGKSSYAEKLAADKGNVVYMATAEACDDEMRARIALHRARRDSSWRTWDGEPETLPDAVAELAASGATILLDSMTVWLSRLVMARGETGDEAEWASSERDILALAGRVFALPASSRTDLIVVSDEVGFSLVPEYRLGRRFRDLQGRANQLGASLADEVLLVVAGLPLIIKGGR